MNAYVWKTIARPTYVVAIAALAALALTPACSKDDGDNSPRGTAVIAGAGANFIGGGYGLMSSGLTYTVQDPSSSNQIATLTLNPTTYPQTAQWVSSAQVGARLYYAQSWANPNTNRLMILLAWAPPGANVPQGSRAELWQGNPTTGAFSRVKSTGTKNWQDISQAIQELGVP